MTKLEQLARAFSVHLDGIPFDEQPSWQQYRARNLARVAVDTLREPTDEMWTAGLNVEFAHKDSTDTAAKAIWQAMIGRVA